MSKPPTHPTLPLWNGGGFEGAFKNGLWTVSKEMDKWRWRVWVIVLVAENLVLLTV
ncbi:MAG: hypothetical protein LKKZDAJK_002138 [Candidatus Fervidibacter sp.]